MLSSCNCENTQDILCSEEEICAILSSLDTSKASGPDGMSVSMLKYVATAIPPSVTKLFNVSIRSSCHYSQ